MSYIEEQNKAPNQKLVSDSISNVILESSDVITITPEQQQQFQEQSKIKQAQQKKIGNQLTLQFSDRDEYLKKIWDKLPQFQDESHFQSHFKFQDHGIQNEGGFGRVRYYNVQNSNAQIAIKQNLIKKEWKQSEEIFKKEWRNLIQALLLEYYYNEKILNELHQQKRQNIVKFIPELCARVLIKTELDDIVVPHEQIYLAFEKLDKVVIPDNLPEDPNLRKFQIYEIIHRTIYQLYLLQKHLQISHSDIKDVNLMFKNKENQKDFEVYFIDFGGAIDAKTNEILKVFSRDYYSGELKNFIEFVGPRYRQLLAQQQQKFNQQENQQIKLNSNLYINMFKQDVYSLGKIFLELIHGQKIQNSKIYEIKDEKILQNFIKDHSKNFDIYTQRLLFEMLHFHTKILEEERPDFINLFEGYNFNKFMLKIIRDKQYNDIQESASLSNKEFAQSSEILFVTNFNMETDFIELLDWKSLPPIENPDLFQQKEQVLTLNHLYKTKIKCKKFVRTIQSLSLKNLDENQLPREIQFAQYLDSPTIIKIFGFQKGELQNNSKSYYLFSQFIEDDLTTCNFNTENQQEQVQQQNEQKQTQQQQQQQQQEQEEEKKEFNSQKQKQADNKLQKQWKFYILIIDCIRAFARLAQDRISHRNLNPQSIFIDNNYTIKIGKFGQARQLQNFINQQILAKKKPATSMAVIQNYIDKQYTSPEFFEVMNENSKQFSEDWNDEYYLKSDVFSLGMIFLSAGLNEKPPIRSDANTKQWNKVGMGKNYWEKTKQLQIIINTQCDRLKSNFREETVELLKLMLKANCKERNTADLLVQQAEFIKFLKFFQKFEEQNYRELNIQINENYRARDTQIQSWLMKNQGFNDESLLEQQFNYQLNLEDTGYQESEVIEFQKQQ